jgi:dolichol kinase
LFQLHKQIIFPQRNDLHLLRKIWHVSVGLIVIIVYYSTPYSSKDWAELNLFIALTAFAGEWVRLRVPKINYYVTSLMGPFMRESERNDYSGFPYYALGCSLSMFFFEEKIALLSILFLIFADPICSLIGVLYGKNKLIGQKSFQGAIAGFIVCTIVAMVYGIIFKGYSSNLLIFSVLSGFIGATAELCSVWIDDNLTIPVVSGFGMTILNVLYHVY